MTIIRCDRCNKELDNSYYIIKFWLSENDPFAKKKDFCEECWEKIIITPSIPFVDEVDGKIENKVENNNKRKRWWQK